MLASLQELHFGGCPASSHFDGLRSASCAAVGLPGLAEVTFGCKVIIFATPALMLGIVEEETRAASKRKLESKLPRESNLEGNNKPIDQCASTAKDVDANGPTSLGTIGRHPCQP